MNYKTSTTAILLSLLLGAHAALAQAPAPAPEPAASKTATAAQQPEMVAADVRKVDKEGGKVTLKHAAIKSLDMPAMTMVFRVSNPALFEKLVEGTSVKAAFEQKDGKYFVTKVETVAK
jgi:Cu(I)/Ag(I) efflux system periplasmic protein CusF